MPNGFAAKAMRRTMAFVPGSIRTTRARRRSELQTEPAADSTMPDWLPTRTVAIGLTRVAADATVVPTTAASRSAPTAIPYFDPANLRAIGTTTTLYHIFRTRLQ